MQLFYARWIRYMTECFSLDIFNNNPDTTLDRSSTDINGSYLFSELFLDILLEVKSNPVKDRNEFIEECTKQYINRTAGLKHLQSFNNDHKPEDALKWYAKPIFLYLQLNKALRMQDIDSLFLFRFFIRDIRAQLTANQYHSPVKVYRAQRMFKHELKQLKKYVHHKISINSFFSTSLDRELAIFYLCDPQISPKENDNDTPVANKVWPIDEENPDAVLKGEVSVLFEIDADPHHVIKEKRPFADISPFSEFGETEQEIVFMLGTVFRIEDTNGIWIINLSLCDDEAEHEIEPIINYFNDEYNRRSNRFNETLYFPIRYG
jgi:hypothetical protein